MYKSFRLTALTLAVLALAAQSAAAAPALPQFPPLAKAAAPAVVNISTEREVSGRDMFGFPPGMDRFFERFGPFQQDPRPRKQSSLGSGFIISSDGYIVTNNHVVDGADKIFVTLQGAEEKGQSLEAKLIGTDQETDLALLKVESSKPLPVLPFGDSDAMEVGDWVLAIGNPFGLSHTVTAGIVSAKGRDIHSGPFDNFLQTDASINPGNSGGPLLNMNGEVVGINTAIVASGQGIGFAIPSNLADRVVMDLKSGKKVSRGWIGVSIQDMDENTAKALGMEGVKGALIGSVMPGEPAARAGLKAGDVITRVGRTDVHSSSELLRSIAALKPGTAVDVTVMRAGREINATITLGERGSHTGGSPESGESAANLGLTVRPLTRDDARALSLPDTQGLLILSVKAGGVAAAAGLEPNDVILSANLTPVSTPDELLSIIKKQGQERGAVLLQINRRGSTYFVTLPLENAKR